MKDRTTANTSTLMSELKDESNLSAFLEENKNLFLMENLPSFFLQMMHKYNIDRNEIISKSNIERSYCYQILRGTRAASRDNYLKICMAMGLNLEDTQCALTLAQVGQLYIKIKRDAAIIFSIQRQYDLDKTQDLLYTLGLKTL